jgi:hypothetical protein
MRIWPSLLTRAPLWCCRVFALAVFSLLGGCANGDFGEVRPTLVSENIHDWEGPYATGSVPSSFDLTDDERALRDWLPANRSAL